METGYIVLVVGLIIAAGVGLYLFADRSSKKTKLKDTYGMLNVVYDEHGSNPQLVLALYDPVEVVANKKQVLFDVNIIHQDSRK